MKKIIKFSPEVTKVLICENDEEQLAKLMDLLSMKDFRNKNIHVCKTFSRAMDKIKKNFSDIAIVNFNLEENKGQKFLQKVNSLPYPMPVIVSAKHQEAVADRNATHYGAYGFISLKAINAEDLEKTIRYACVRKKIEDKLTLKTFQDDLSNLPNTRAFVKKLSNAVEEAKIKHRSVCLVYIDLNNFKEINDTFGHQAGDQVIQTISKRLRNCLRETDTPARIGGDEFACILEGIRNTEVSNKIIERIIKIFKKPVLIKDNLTCKISGSIGISFYPDTAKNIKELIALADQAMYEAKTIYSETGKAEALGWESGKNSLARFV